MSEFARKTGDYSQLSGVDLQVLALLYDLEVEAANLYNDGKLDHVRRDPKRVLGVSVKALSGDGKRDVKVRGRERGDSVATSSGGSVATSTNASGSVMSSTAFFHGNASGIIDPSHIDLDYGDDDDDGEDRVIVDAANGVFGLGDDDSRDDVAAASNTVATKPNTWAKLVNPEKASAVPLVNYSIATESKTKKAEEAQEEEQMDLTKTAPAAASTEAGQFDDASESSKGEDDDAFSSADDEDGELDAINIANANSDDEMSDEECDVFILDPHEAVYYKKLREAKEAASDKEELVSQMENQTLQEPKVEDGGLDSEFPSLAAAAAVPYDGSDDEGPEEFPAPEEKLAWQQEEEERKKKALQPMVNGRVVKNDKQKSYNSFRRYKNVVSASGSAVAMKQQKEEEQARAEEAQALPEQSADADKVQDETMNNNGEYKSRILGAAAPSGSDFPSEMTADDDDGEGWVTCTRDIQNMKATGSLHLSHKNSYKKGSAPRKDVGPPISQRAACATTDFAMQNVILQMNLELLSVDGVRVRRLKTWVTRCGACFTIYGNDDKKGQRLFCDKCGSNTLHRIAASVDRNSGRLKLHMKKNYQYNTRGTKFALPKAGKANKYEGDLLLAEDQLMYGAWNQKVRKGKSKTSGQSIFGSDLASDLGCHADLTKRDDIKVGFGRRNPNSTKFGRERRGKKKKNTKDKACGLRRY
jgi:RNA-binding protein NOB1